MSFDESNSSLSAEDGEDIQQLEPDDGWSDKYGCEKCPLCNIIYSPNGGYIGPVYDTEGNRYESYADADPMDAPFPCEDCWQEIKTDVRARQHRTLDVFGGESRAE